MDLEIDRYIGGNPIEASKNAATEINKSNGKFLNFIEGLGTYLTSPDNVARGRATHMIGDVLEFLPSYFLNEEQVVLVSNFLLAKLADHHSVQPHALQSIAVLTTRCCPLPDGLPVEICKNIFREVQNQSLSQADRRATYTTLQNLLGSHEDALRDMDGDFIIGFIQQMDAEKDPRNLMICFSCAHFICSKFQLGTFKEEMFEVLGCYFPVDFTPPPNDPFKITKEELIVALRKCLASTPDFAEFCLPLLLEKMGSDNQAARTDAFMTLTACAPIYGRGGLAPFLGSIISCVRREVLMSVSKDMVDTARYSITAVLTAMMPSDNVKTNDDTLKEAIVELYQDCVKFLNDSDVAKSCLAYSLLQSVAVSSTLAFCSIIPLVLPSLISACNQQLQAKEQLAYVRQLIGFLEAFRLFKQNEEVRAVFANQLIPVSDLCETLFNADKTDLQSEATKAIAILTTSELGLGSEVRDKYLDVLVTRATAWNDPNSRTHIVACLRSIAKENTQFEIQAIDSIIKRSETCEIAIVADVLSHTVVHKESFITVFDFLISSISNYFNGSTSYSCTVCLQSLSDSITSINDQKINMEEALVEKVCLPLIRSAVSSSSSWTEENKLSIQKTLTALRDVFRVVGVRLSKSHSQSLWEKVCSLFMDGNGSIVGLEDLKDFKPLTADSPWQQTQLIVLMEGLMVSLDIMSMTDRRDNVFETMFSLALYTEDSFTHISATRCAAAFLNKAPLGSQIHWFLEPVTQKLQSTMNGNGSLPSRTRALTIWAWFTKAMESRGHSATAILSSHLVSLVADSVLGSEAGRLISMVVQDMEDTFSKSLHSCITPLYKQRFFTLNLKTLLEGYRAAPSRDIKGNHVTAISGLASNLPLQVMKPQLSQLVPLLLESLGENQTANLSQILNTVSAAVSNAPETLTSSIDTLVSRLMVLARKHPEMRVRISSLKCLEEIAGLPCHLVAPHQARVVRELRSTLDDKKRLVRQQAVETRSAWILLEKVNPS